MSDTPPDQRHTLHLGPGARQALVVLSTVVASVTAVLTGQHVAYPPQPAEVRAPAPVPSPGASDLERYIYMLGQNRAAMEDMLSEIQSTTLRREDLAPLAHQLDVIQIESQRGLREIAEEVSNLKKSCAQRD